LKGKEKKKQNGKGVDVLSIRLIDGAFETGIVEGRERGPKGKRSIMKK